MRPAIGPGASPHISISEHAHAHAAAAHRSPRARAPPLSSSKPVQTPDPDQCQWPSAGGAGRCDHNSTVVRPLGWTRRPPHAHTLLVPVPAAMYAIQGRRRVEGRARRRSRRSCSHGLLNLFGGWGTPDDPRSRCSSSTPPRARFSFHPQPRAFYGEGNGEGREGVGGCVGASRVPSPIFRLKAWSAGQARRGEAAPDVEGARAIIVAGAVSYMEAGTNTAAKSPARGLGPPRRRWREARGGGRQ